MKLNQQGVGHGLLIASIALLVVYSAIREHIPDFYNGIITGVAIVLLALTFTLYKRKPH